MDRTLLIFNAAAGSEPPEAQLAELRQLLARVGIEPRVYHVHSRSRLSAVVARAVREGTQVVFVAGGDNTLSQVARALVGTSTRLGIMPTGTRNNIAHSLKIPTELDRAVALVADGQVRAIDVMQTRFRGGAAYCVEVGMVGLGAAIFPSADQLQKGDLSQLGAFLNTLVTHAPAAIGLTLDDAQAVPDLVGHLVVVANMPLVGPNYQLAPDVAPDDGLLDVFVFPDLTKFDLVNYARQLASGGTTDERVRHFRSTYVQIKSDPPLDVMTDGVMRPPGLLTARAVKHAVNVFAPSQSSSS